MDKEYRKALLFRTQTGKQHLLTYKKELTNILRVNLDDIKLLGLEETDQIIEERKKNDDSISFKQTVPFDQKEEYLNFYIQQISQSEYKEIYIYTAYSKVCGLCIIDNLNRLKLDFTFDSEHGGLIIIYSKNLEDKMLLDFYEEDGNYLLDIEFSGNVWGKINKKQ